MLVVVIKNIPHTYIDQKHEIYFPNFGKLWVLRSTHFHQQVGRGTWLGPVVVFGLSVCLDDDDLHSAGCESVKDCKWILG